MNGTDLTDLCTPPPLRTNNKVGLDCRHNNRIKQSDSSLI